MSYKQFDDLMDLVKDIPEDAIISKTIFQSDETRYILFGFAPGQELSEHTASKTAMLHIMKGTAKVTLGKDSFDAKEGFWTLMEANLPHSIVAESEVVMLLEMLG